LRAGVLPVAHADDNAELAKAAQNLINGADQYADPGQRIAASLRENDIL